MHSQTLNINIPKILSAVFSFVFLLTTFYLLPSTLVTAQQLPEFMVTWKSNNYAPPSFQGKILPIANSQIEMALEIIDGGKLTNISGNEIRWLINDAELKSGVGLKNISFAAEGIKGDQEIEIVVKNYKGQDLEKTIEIPLARPEVVIAGGPNIFEALPYFFNVQNISQLRFVWSANNQIAGGIVDNPALIELDTTDYPTGSVINLNLEARSAIVPTEIAGKSINIQK